MRKNPQVDLTHYLRSKRSPLADHVPQILESANRYRIDPRLIVAISGGETSFATNGRGPKSYNAWGIGPGRAYGSWAEGIDAAAKLLRESYVGKGLTSMQAIQRKWAPIGAGNDPSNLNSNWLRTNGQFYRDLGGNPDNVTLGWRNASSPAKAPARLPTRVPAQANYFAPVAQIAMQNLASIAAGKKPEDTLADLVQTMIASTEAEAAAQRTLDQPPVPKDNASPDGGKYSYTRTNERAANPKKQNAVDLALKQIGKPYVWGSEGPKSFDCSGLIEWAYEQAGIKTPGRLTTYSAVKLGHSVKGGPMQPGDWIITNRGKHMVMYIGGGEVIAAPRSGTNVQVQPLSQHKAGIVDVRRYP